MFYLETKDGEKFLTIKNSDDRAEFGKILEDKLGRQAGEIFNDLINEASEDSQEVFNSARSQFKACIDRLDAALTKKPASQAELEEILSDFQGIYLDYFM